MALGIVAGTANPALANAIATCLDCDPAPCVVEKFPDSELRPVVGHLRGDDVYVVQPTAPPVSEHLVELLLLLDGCRRAGAGRVTAVVPYFGYARQDRRGRAGEAVGARVAVDTIAAAGGHHLLLVDPHTVALEAMCSVPVEMLTAVPLLAAELASDAVAGDVVVAPDLGAVKLAEHYAALLGRPVAVVRKNRVSGERVEATELVGDVEGRRVIIVDDMISTGGTIGAAVGLLRAHRAAPDMVVAATHGLFVGPATTRLVRPSLRRMLVTDTVAVTKGRPLAVEVGSTAPLLADAIGRLHRDEPLDDLLIRA